MELPLGSSPSMNDHHEIETDKSAVELPLALKAIDNDGPIWMLYCSKVADTRGLGLASQGGLSSFFYLFPSGPIQGPSNPNWADLGSGDAGARPLVVRLSFVSFLFLCL